MALTLEQLQQQRDDIIATMRGTRSVRFADRAVDHGPQADLEAALARVEVEIARMQGSSQSRQFTIQTSRGL